MIIRFTPEADTELAEARNWYAYQREDLDLDFIEVSMRVSRELLPIPTRIQTFTRV